VGLLLRLLLLDQLLLEVQLDLLDLAALRIEPKLIHQNTRTYCHRYHTPSNLLQVKLLQFAD
jgi:hypothetical protein